jgi:ParB family transcriptional regulator, chromosome partitioning protein
MQIVQIAPSRVLVQDRLRAVDADYIDWLAASMDAHGLRSPIQVGEADTDGRHRLISGAHRHAAAVQLGWETMPAVVFSGSELEAELLEIEENLVRRELSPLDQATFLAKHKAIWETLHPHTKHGGDRRRKSSRQDGGLKPAHALAQRFSAAAAKKLGLAERSVQRAVARYEALSPRIRERIASTWLADNGAALDDLVGRARRLTEAEQSRVLDIVLDPASGIRRVQDALIKLRIAPPRRAAEAGASALRAAWERERSAEGRARFLDWLLMEGKGGALVLAAIGRLQADPVNRFTADELVGAGLISEDA